MRERKQEILQIDINFNQPNTQDSTRFWIQALNLKMWGSAKRKRTKSGPKEIMRTDVATNTSDMGEAMELWDGDEDGIDDSVLLMASQMVEETAEKETKTKAAPTATTAVDQSDLADMSRMLEQDADWNDDEVFCEEAAAVLASSSGKADPQFAEKPLQPVLKSSTADDFAKPRTPPRLRPTSKTSQDELKSLKDLLARREAEIKKLSEDKMTKHGEVLHLRGELSKREAALQKERAERAKVTELRATEVRRAEETRKAQVEKMETEAAFMRRDMENMAAQMKRAKVTTVKQEPEDDKKRVPNVRNGPIAIDESLLCGTSPQRQKVQNVNTAKMSPKFSPKRTINASVQTDNNDGGERRKRRRNIRRIRMRRDPDSRSIATVVSAVSKRMTIIGAEQKVSEILSAAIVNVNATGDAGSSALSAAELIVLNIKSHIENRSSDAEMLLDLIEAARVLLESKMTATSPLTEKESLGRALRSLAAGFGGKKSIFQLEDEAADEKPLSHSVSEERDFDRCLAAFYHLVQVAVSASAVTPNGLAAVLVTLTPRLRQV